MLRAVPQEISVKVMAAADLIADQGLDGTKSEDIASVAGISKATLYYYFDGKEAVLSHIFGVLLDALGDAVEHAASGPGDAMERLHRVVDGHLGIVATYPKAARALHFDLGRAARLPEIDEKTRQAYIDPVCKLLQDGAIDGTVRRLRQPRLAAIALLAATTTAAIFSTSIDGIGDLESVNEMVSELVLDGLSTRGDTP
jgi:TetR/AcrR family transcriptional regulator